MLVQNKQFGLVVAALVFCVHQIFQDVFHCDMFTNCYERHAPQHLVTHGYFVCQSYFLVAELMVLIRT